MGLVYVSPNAASFLDTRIKKYFCFSIDDGAVTLTINKCSKLPNKEQQRTHTHTKVNIEKNLPPKNLNGKFISIYK